MKKFLLIFVILVALLTSLVGCSQTPPAETTTPDQPTSAVVPAVDTFSVGYARADITPKEIVPLGGSLTVRYSSGPSGVLDPLYATSIAFSDEKGTTVVFITLDLTRSYSEIIPLVRSYVSEKTGIPVDNIITSASHTHSGPDLSQTGDPAIQKYNAALKDQVLEAVQNSLADRKPAKMYTGYTRVENTNYVRHYLLDNGTYAGSNFGDFNSGEKIGHVTKADDLLQVVKFTREGGKPVILTNWQGHYRAPTSDTVTADFFGVMRDTLEEELDCQFAYVAGAGGNVNNRSLIESEPTTADYVAHGRKLSNVVKALDPELKEAKVGKIQILKGVYAAALKESPNVTMDITLYTFCLGDVAFACAPYEMFDTNGVFIRENSDFQMTFVATQSNAHLFYIPTPDAYDYESYEADVARVAKGSAEGLADKFVSMLDEMYSKTGLTPAKKDDSFYTKPVEPASDGLVYINPEVGNLTAFKETPCGAMQIQLITADGTKNILVQTKELTEKILAGQAASLVFNYSGVVTDALVGDELGIVAHEEPVVVTNRAGAAVTLQNADGTVVELTLADGCMAFDAREGATAVGVSLQTNDTIRYLADRNGKIVVAYLMARNPVKSLCAHCQEEVEWNEWHSDSTMPAAPKGHFKLMVDVELEKEYVLKGGEQLILDLNGHTITGAKDNRVIRVNGSSTRLAVLDSSAEETGAIIGRGTKTEEGVCVWAYSGIFDLYSGTIDGSQVTNTNNGCTVQCSTAGGVINMYGGTIIGGKTVSSATAGGKGGSVSVAHIMNMYGGVIRDGEAVAYMNGNTYVRGGQGGNVYVASTGTFTMYGGTITGGKAQISDDNINVGTVGDATGVFIQEGGNIG